MPWQHCFSDVGRYGAASLGMVSGLRVVALVVTLPAHWEQPYWPPPSTSLRFRVHRHNARLAYQSVTSLGFGVSGLGLHVFGHPRRQQSSRGVKESLAVCPDFDEVGVVALGAGVVHGHVRGPLRPRVTRYAVCASPATQNPTRGNSRVTGGPSVTHQVQTRICYTANLGFPAEFAPKRVFKHWWSPRVVTPQDID